MLSSIREIWQESALQGQERKDCFVWRTVKLYRKDRQAKYGWGGQQARNQRQTGNYGSFYECRVRRYAESSTIITARTTLTPNHFLRLAWNAARLVFDEVRKMAITKTTSANATFAV
jgi:hypothetical protein